MKARPKKARVTLADVADRVGVSVSTASLILSGREVWLRQFHADTVRKVRAAAERLGYRANLFATGLPSKAWTFFALILRDLREEELGTWHHWAFEGSFLGGAIRGANENGVHPVVTTTHRGADTNALDEVGRIIDGGVFGAIVRTPHPPLEQLLRARVRKGFPVVVVFPTRPRAWPRNAIDVDNVEMGERVARLLAARGRRRCVFVRYASAVQPHRDRGAGFARFAKKAGIVVHTLRMPLGTDEHQIAQIAAPQLRRLKADGVFGVDSVSSVGSLIACVKLGLRPAEDVDIVGCDASFWRAAEMPSLSCADVSWRAVGALAVAKLLEAARGRSNEFPTILLKPRLVAGGTCPIPPEFNAQGV